MHVLNVQQRIKPVVALHLLHVQDRQGKYQGRQVTLHALHILNAQEVYIIQRARFIIRKGIASQLLNAPLILLRVLQHLQFKMLVSRNQKLVVKQQLSISLRDDVVVHQNLTRILVRAVIAHQFVLALSHPALHRQLVNMRLLFRRYNTHLVPRVLRPTQKVIPPHHALPILVQFRLQFTARLALERTVLYLCITFRLLFLHPTLAGAQSCIANEEGTLIPRICLTKRLIAQGVRHTRKGRHHLRIQLLLLDKTRLVHQDIVHRE